MEQDGSVPHEILHYVRSRMSGVQWREFRRIIDELGADGVQKLQVKDIVAIVESVVLSGDDSVTVEDLERLTGNG